MIKFKNNRRVALLLVLAMLATMFIGVGTASAKSINSIDRVTSVSDDFDGVLGATVTIAEDEDYADQFKAGDSFRLILPSGVKWNNAPNLGAGATAKLSGDQIVDVTINTVTANVDKISFQPDIEVSSIEGAIELEIDAMDSAVTSGKITIATVGAGKMSVAARSVEKIGKNGTGGVIELKENSIGAVGAVSTANELTLKLPPNFKWNADMENVALKNVTLGGGFAGSDVVAEIDNDDSRTLNITFENAKADGTAADARGIIYVTPVIQATNSAAKGEITVSISGENAAGSDIADADIVVADYVGYSVTTSIKEVKQLTAGKFVQKTAEITLKEDIKGTLLKDRDITVTLPEWVKITEYDETKDSQNIFNAPSYDAGEDNYFDLTVGDTTTSAEDLRFKLSLSIEANKTGDIEATISGAGIDEQKLVIATAVAPATITGNTSDIKVGIQDQALKDIVITAGVKDGIVKTYNTQMSGDNDNKNGAILVTLTQGVGFAKEPTVKVTKGNLEVNVDGIALNDIDGVDDQLSIPIKSEATNISEITISDIQVTLDRTVPEGPIYAKLGGKAIVENSGTAANSGLFDTGTVNKSEIGKVVTPAPDNDLVNVSEFVIGASTYKLNGQEVTAVAPSYAKNNRTYLAIRDVAHSLGIDDSNILWDGISSTVTLMKGDKVVQLKLGSNVIVINGAAVTMDVAVEASNGRTFLPAAFVAQAFGSAATYDAATNTVTIK